MGSRTYLPKLQSILRLVCLYITRYETTIKANLPTSSSALVDAVVTACSALDAVLVDNIPQGD